MLILMLQFKMVKFTRKLVSKNNQFIQAGARIQVAVRPVMEANSQEHVNVKVEFAHFQLTMIFYKLSHVTQRLVSLDHGSEQAINVGQYVNKKVGNALLVAKTDIAVAEYRKLIMEIVRQKQLKLLQQLNMTVCLRFQDHGSEQAVNVGQYVNTEVENAQLAAKMDIAVAEICHLIMEIARQKQSKLL